MPHTSQLNLKRAAIYAVGFLLPLLLLLSGLSVVDAQTPNPHEWGESTNDTGTPNPHAWTGENPNFDNTGSGSCGETASGLVNPLKVCTISGLLFAILDILLVFAYPVVIFFIVYAGFKFVTAQGDTGKLAEARSALTWAIMGGVIVLGAHLLVTVIEGTVDAFR